MRKPVVIVLPLLLTIVSGVFWFSPPGAAVKQTGSVTQVRLSWAQDPRTSMTVTWQDKASDAKSHVKYGQTPQSLDREAQATTTRYPHETGVIHHATLTGLKPSTTYYYRVFGSEPDSNGEARTFQTAPDKEQPFVFTAYGDQGVTVEAKEIVNRVLLEKPAFHLHLGDLSYANSADRGFVWDEWLEMIEPLASRVAYMPTLGNHENERLTPLSIEKAGYAAYLARFALPGGEKWYAFDYAGVRFVAFNSDDYTNAEQLRWMREALLRARQDDVRWLIVFVHHPLYSSTVRRENDFPRVAVLEKLLDEFKVDMLLGGHHHNYERSYPLRNGLVTFPDSKRTPKGIGTIHVTSGGGGKPLYDFVPEKPSRAAAREKAHNFIRINANSTSLALTAIRRDGSIIDQFEITETL